MNCADACRALIGGALIGASATLYLLVYGRIAGISGLVGGLFLPNQDRRARGSFIVGLFVAGAVAHFVSPCALRAPSLGMIGIAVSGLLVGIGTTLGNGCTSGHGVCGIARLSPRSLVATCAFMLAGMIVVYVVRHSVGR